MKRTWARLQWLVRAIRRRAPAPPPEQIPIPPEPAAPTGTEPVTGDMLAALQEHFQAGGHVDSAERWETDRLLPQPVKMTVAKFSLPPRGNDPLIVVDGSGATQDRGIGAAAAVTADGRALIGWWQHEEPLTPQFAEFQAIRLGLRLAARYPQARVFSDAEGMCAKLSNGGITRSRIAQMIGCNDPAAIGEVLADLRDQPVTLRWMGRLNENHVGSHQLAVTAHRLAYAACGMVCDGFDPGAQLAWLAHFGQHQGRNRESVRESYGRWVARQERLTKNASQANDGSP